MTISVIGIGRIGLGIALNFENLGHNVIGYDINQKYVNSINDKSYNSSEPLYNTEFFFEQIPINLILYLLVN